jgi:hypothetical protein
MAVPGYFEYNNITIYCEARNYNAFAHFAQDSFGYLGYFLGPYMFLDFL